MFASSGWAQVWQSWPALLMALGLIPFLDAKAFHRTYLSPDTTSVPSGDSLTSGKRGMREKRNQCSGPAIPSGIPCANFPIEPESVIAGRP
jgi:hypothetical protein